MRISNLFLIIGVIVGAQSISLSRGLLFNFGSGSFESVPIDEVVMDGDASISRVGIELNRATTRSVGRALHRQPMELYASKHGNTKLADFSCNFSFDSFSNASGGGGGGGLAFVLVPQDSNWYASSYGGLLGLIDSNVSALDVSNGQNNRFVAVEVDEGLDRFWDFSSKHVGIDVNSLKSRIYVNLTGAGFMNVGTVSGVVDYNSTTKNLSVSFTSPGGALSLFHIVDLEEVLPERVQVGFTASTGSGSVLIHRITSWGCSSPDLNTLSGRDRKAYIPKLVGLLGAALLILVGGGICLYRRLSSETKQSVRLIDHSFRSDSHQEAADLDGCGVEEVPYELIREATGNFDARFRIGEGASGAVYLCDLGHLGMGMVAVKKFKNRPQGFKEFSSELDIGSKTIHENVVKLVCRSRNSADLLLCYEYMAKGSLDNHLRGERLPLLPWRYRYQVMRGVAAGVRYLHQRREQYVIHRDIKSANVLLDGDYNSKVADFGVSRFAKQGESMKTTTEYGTPGYVAPEVACDITKASTKSDVYSFGILLLEVVTGIDPRSERLVPLVWGFHVKNYILAAVDNRLRTEFNPIQAKCLLLVGLRCCNNDPAKRPPMEDVVSMLNDPDSMPRRPLYPPHPQLDPIAELP